MGSMRWHLAGEQVGEQVGHRVGERQQPVPLLIWLEQALYPQLPKSPISRASWPYFQEQAVYPLMALLLPLPCWPVSMALLGWMFTMLKTLLERASRTWLEPPALPRAFWTLLHLLLFPSQAPANPRFMQAAIQFVANRFQSKEVPGVFQGGLTAYD
jgi:hypothetical protein